MTSPIVVVASAEGAARLAHDLAAAPRVALDIESDGMFAYRAGICTVQLAWGDHVAVLDTLKTPIAPLADVLGERGPLKVVHDVGFDARLLAEAGIAVGNVHDTAIAARMLGRTATGLASVLMSELGVGVDKKLQHHDWRERPLSPEMLSYLTADVAHLERLDDVIFREVSVRGIEDEVLEETRYRIASSILAVKEPDPRAPYQRVKGVERVSGVELAVLRRLAEARDHEASRRDVPPHLVLSAEALLDVARARPVTFADLVKMRGVPSKTRDAIAFAEEMLRAIARGVDDGEVPEEERAAMQRPRLATEVAKARRAREGRLSAWRKEEAKRRGVDEQVILPGHCLKGLAELDDAREDDVAAIAGLGAFRVARDGAKLLSLLRDGGAP